MGRSRLAIGCRFVQTRHTMSCWYLTRSHLPPGEIHLVRVQRAREAVRNDLNVVVIAAIGINVVRLRPTTPRKLYTPSS